MPNLQHKRHQTQHLIGTFETDGPDSAHNNTLNNDNHQSREPHPTYRTIQDLSQNRYRALPHTSKDPEPLTMPNTADMDTGYTVNNS